MNLDQVFEAKYGRGNKIPTAREEALQRPIVDPIDILTFPIGGGLAARLAGKGLQTAAKTAGSWALANVPYDIATASGLPWWASLGIGLAAPAGIQKGASALAGRVGKTITSMSPMTASKYAAMKERANVLKAMGPERITKSAAKPATKSTETWATQAEKARIGLYREPLETPTLATRLNKTPTMVTQAKSSALEKQLGKMPNILEEAGEATRGAVSKAEYPHPFLAGKSGGVKSSKALAEPPRTAVESEKWASDLMGELKAQQGELSAEIKEVIESLPSHKVTKVAETVPKKVGKVVEKGVKKSPVSSNYLKWFKERLYTAKSEEHAQNILDSLDSNKILPGDVHEKFWKDTFWKLDGSQQDYFKKYAKKLFNEDDPTKIVKFAKGESPLLHSQLEGIERGYWAMMDEANRIIKSSKFSKELSKIGGK